MYVPPPGMDLNGQLPVRNRVLSISVQSLIIIFIGDGTMLEFNGNVRNFGIIDNLPGGCCVEVPVLVSKRGLNPKHVGSLPDHLSTLNNVSAGCNELD